MQAADFVRSKLWEPEKKRLRRSFRQGPSPTQGFADDYAYLIAGLLDLYEACADLSCLTWAVELQQAQDELFWDDQAGEPDSSALSLFNHQYNGSISTPRRCIWPA